MKKPLYRVTKTGIRIPKKKIRWMAPIKEEAPDTLNLPAPADKEFADLWTNFFLGVGRSAESDWGGDPFEDGGM